MCDKKGIEYASEFTVAPSGSTIPDLVMTIDGKRVQFEIKGTNARANEITFFDITARRTQNAKSKIGKIELDILEFKYNLSVIFWTNPTRKLYSIFLPLFTIAREDEWLDLVINLVFILFFFNCL